MASLSVSVDDEVLRTPTRGYDVTMAEIPVRELRNDTAGVLRRVETGEDVTITVHGQPVARLVPVETSRGRVIPREEFVAWLRRSQADPALRDELRELAGEMSDETEIDW